MSMSIDISNMRKQLYETALSAGMPIISGDKCCQLLAWLYIYGGANEQPVFNERLNNAIVYAQERVNLNGGETPDIELLPVLQGYIASIPDFYNPPEWVIELEKEYGIKPQRAKSF